MKTHKIADFDLVLKLPHQAVARPTDELLSALLRALDLSNRLPKP